MSKWVSMWVSMGVSIQRSRVPTQTVPTSCTLPAPRPVGPSHSAQCEALEPTSFTQTAVCQCESASVQVGP